MSRGTFFHLNNLSVGRSPDAGSELAGSELADSSETIATETSTSNSSSSGAQPQHNQRRHWTRLADFTRAICGACHPTGTLRGRWKTLAVIFLFAINLFVLGVLQASTSERIEENARQIGQLKVLAKQAPMHLHTDNDFTWEVDASKIGSSGKRNSQLTMLSLQKQLTAVKTLAERNRQDATAKEAKLQSLEMAGKQMAQMLLTEANLTLCTKEGMDPPQRHVMSLGDGVYRAEFTSRVSANTMYANKKLFELSKNGNLLKNGGVIRAKSTWQPNVRCMADAPTSQVMPSQPVVTPEPAFPPPDCISVKEVLLVRLASADVLEVKEFVTAEGGTVHGLRLCIVNSEYATLPIGLESLIVTHR